MKLRLLLLAAACLAGPASAAWHQVSSPHFVIYADEDPAKLKAYAEKLERFDKAVRLARGMKDPALSPGNRLPIYVVADTVAVSKLHPGKKSVAGFYRPGAITGVAVVPKSVPKTMLTTADQVFFHEYAHHLTMQDFRAPLPAWLVEGFAEFYATADVNADGSVGIGGGAVNRSRTLRQPRNPLPYTQMLKGVRPAVGAEQSAMYARGWLLTHYLVFSKQRAGQLDAYLAGLAAGKDATVAATDAFGDISTLEIETDRYLREDKFPYLTLPASSLPIGTVTVSALGPVGEAIMPLKTRLAAGMDEDRARLAADIRAVAARFPDSELAQVTLAEAEFLTGNYDAAKAAADAALKLNANSVPAMLYMGRAILEQAKAKAGDARFAEARGWFNRANRIEPENPIPLMMFFQSYASERVAPTANAIAALRYAAELAPQDLNLRLAAGRTYLASGDMVKARAMLAAVAYHPHGGKASDEARALIEKTK